ncbi:MAG TPA: class I SAM-dependent methyltransferase, partial [Burkholderiaceae bacterium]|nr:class I SAM-dependent methyltransferase [Burkholderiaceae bacterium]
LLKTRPADGTTKRATPAARMAKLARLARARGFLWTAFYNLYAAAVIEGDQEAGFQLADVLIAFRPSEVLPEVDEAFQLALRTPWTRPASLTRAIVDYLLLDPRVEQITEEVNLSTDDLDLAAGVLARNELFATLLQTSVANDLRLERLLIALRDHLLAVAPSTPGALRLAALLATQANLVEYLWPYTTGPIEAQTTHDRPLQPVTSARALLNCMFRPPNGAEINAIELIAADPAISCLLERVRDEPILHTRCRDELERTAVCLGTSAVNGHNGSRSGARWVKEPFAPRKVPLAVHRRLRARRFEAGDVLVAGCGTGQDLFAVRATYPNAHVTALEANTDKLAHAARKCAEAGLPLIELLPGSLLDVAPLGWTFDLIECPGLQRHVPDADFGCEALARCSRSGSLLRLAVYSDATCRLVSALRRSAQMCGISRALGDLQRFRAELLEGLHGALPPSLLQSPEFHTASGLRDLLFADGEVALGTSAWIAMLHIHGFDFVCEEVNGDLVRAARAAGFPGAPLWSVRDSRRFQREQPFAFGGTQFLWFERRARLRR